MQWVECGCGARFESEESVFDALAKHSKHVTEMAALDEFHCTVTGMSVRDESKEVQWPTKHDARDAMPRSSG